MKNCKPNVLIACLFLLFTLGCDKLCKKNVEDIASIQNMTGRALTLKFCRALQNGAIMASISSDTHTNDVSLGIRESSEVRGGPGASCSGVGDGEKTRVSPTLTGASFQQVKLCLGETSYTSVIRELWQACPTRFIAQIEPASCE